MGELPIDTRDTPRPPRRLEGADLAIAAAIMAAGLAIRLWCWSGVGLADDGIFMPFISMVVQSNNIAGNLGYRFTWWLPTAVAAQLLGEGEMAMVLPCLVYSVLGIGLVYAVAHMLWGRWAAMIAAALVAVHPLDVTFSTMVTSDVVLSFFSALTIFALLRALAHDDPIARRRWWVVAAAGLVLSYHSKVSGLLLLPVTAAIVWRQRDRLDGIRWFVWTVTIAFGVSALVAFAMTGNLLGPIRSEMFYQGLLQSPAGRQVTSADLLLYPEVLFRRPHLRSLLNGPYPHALALFVLLAWPLRLRVEPALWWWFMAILLGLIFNVQYLDGYWVSGFRNVRHAHILVYPLCLLLAGYLGALRTRAPRLAAVAATALLVWGLVEARSASTKTQESFADTRTTCRFLAGLTPSVVYLDEAIDVRCRLLSRPPLAGWRMEFLGGFPDQRATKLATAQEGYVVTGGGREPVYLGGPVARASELPADRVELVLERAGPLDELYRPEPLRIWKLRAPAPPSGAGDLVP
jgi:hypothetical protein